MHEERLLRRTAQLGADRVRPVLRRSSARKLWSALAQMLDDRAAKVRAELEEAARLRREAEAMLRDAETRRARGAARGPGADRGRQGRGGPRCRRCRRGGRGIGAAARADGDGPHRRRREGGGGRGPADRRRGRDGGGAPGDRRGTVGRGRFAADRYTRSPSCLARWQAGEWPDLHRSSSESNTRGATAEAACRRLGIPAKPPPRRHPWRPALPFAGADHGQCRDDRGRGTRAGR